MTTLTQLHRLLLNTSRETGGKCKPEFVFHSADTVQTLLRRSNYSHPTAAYLCVETEVMQQFCFLYPAGILAKNR